MKLIIAGQVFGTKEKAKAFAVEMAKKYIGERIDQNSPDFGVFMDLWTRSPNFREGECHFEVGRRFNSVAVKTVMHDGEVVDWSLRNAVSGRFPSQHTQLTLAMRLSIRPQIQSFKQHNRKCEICYSWEDIQIDHVLPFKEIMRRFLDTGKAPEFYHFSASGWSFTKEHREYEERWYEFHRAHAKLRPLCSRCHGEVTLAARRQEQRALAEREVESVGQLLESQSLAEADAETDSS